MKPTQETPQRALPVGGLALALFPLLGAVGCASSGDTTSRVDRIENLTREGAYEEAAAASVQALRELREDAPERERVERLQREISVASGLEAARRLSLADEDNAALEIVEELAAAHPDIAQIEEWDQRLRAKLSFRWFEIAREAVAVEDFDLARQAYAKSVEYQPESGSVAAALLADLDRIEEYRADVAERTYYAGVRHFTDLEIAEAVNRFGAVQKYDKGNEKALRRESEAKRVMAEGRVAEADRLAQAGLFSAAAKEYAQAAQLDPASESIARNLEALRVEAAVQDELVSADSMALRKEFDRAEGVLRGALERTALQREVVEANLTKLAESRAEEAYREALGYEHDFQFERALTRYGSILESREFYKDVRARMDVLEGYIRDAERLYEEARTAKSDAEKLGLYRQIEVFWPEYRDVHERVQRLAKRVPEAQVPSARASAADGQD